MGHRAGKDLEKAVGLRDSRVKREGLDLREKTRVESGDCKPLGGEAGREAVEVCSGSCPSTLPLQ